MTSYGSLAKVYVFKNEKMIYCLESPLIKLQIRKYMTYWQLLKYNIKYNKKIICILYISLLFLNSKVSTSVMKQNVRQLFITDFCVNLGLGSIIINLFNYKSSLRSQLFQVSKFMTSTLLCEGKKVWLFIQKVLYSPQSVDSKLLL